MIKIFKIIFETIKVVFLISIITLMVLICLLCYIPHRIYLFFGELLRVLAIMADIKMQLMDIEDEQKNRCGGL